MSDRPSFFSFTLPESFVSEYKNKKPPFGYRDAAGTSLGEITFARTYSHKKEDGTKEQWYEVVRRVVEGTYSLQKDYCLSNRLPWNGSKALASAKDMYDRFFNLKASPPGRGLSQMGRTLVNEHKLSSPLQNCSAISTGDMTRVDPSAPFVFMLSASSLGIGVGFDVRGADKEFEIYKPSTKRSYIFKVPDSREGWAEALKLLINSYLVRDRSFVDFDYSEVRPAGAPIKTFGGTASGPGPLKEMLEGIRDIFVANEGGLLTQRHIADMMNMIGKCIVAGGARRSAQLMVGKLDDPDYLDFKNYEKFPERGSFGWASNNSVDVEVGDDLTDIVEGIQRNGEPGVLWMDVTRKYGRLADAPDNKDHRAVLYNPCLTGGSLLLNENGYVSFLDAAKSGVLQNLIVDSRVTYQQSADGVEHPDNWKIDYKTGKRGVFQSASEVFLTKKNADIVKVSTFEGFDVRLTPDHLVATKEDGMVPAAELKLGQKILLTAGNLPSWSAVGEPETIEEIEHALMGLITGDGRMCVDSKRPNKHHSVSVDLWNDDRTHIERVCSWMQTVYDYYGDSFTSDSNRPMSAYYVSHIESSNKTYITSTYLAKVLQSKYGFGPATKHVVPEYTMNNCRSRFAAFYVAGLAFADGTVNKYASKVGSSCIRINQSNKPLLQQVQLILLANGIESKIYSRRKEGDFPMPDGKGGTVLYRTRENFDLLLTANKYEYAKHIGFLGSHKDTLAQSLFTKPSNKGATFTAKVVSVVSDGNEDVYCLREPNRRILAANGITMRRCAEQPLESGEMCTLSCVFLNNAESKEDFLKTLKYAYLYAKTVTLLPTQWEETNAIMQRNRRIGVSLGGIADFVDTHGLPTAREWMDEGYKALKNLDKKYSEWLCVRESIKISTVKPDGSVGLLAGTSPGVHWTPGGKFFKRRITLQNGDPLIEQFKKSGYVVETSYYSPESAVVVEMPIKSGSERSEGEVSIFEKIHLASEAQRWWSDNSVSVTVSFDESEKEHIGRVLHMYEGGLKTVSFLPMGGKYEQMPYEPITEDEYEELRLKIRPVDLSPVYGLESEEVEEEKFCTNDSCLLPTPQSEASME